MTDHSVQEYVAQALHELELAGQVTEQKGAAYYFQRAQVLATLAMATATANKG